MKKWLLAILFFCSFSVAAQTTGPLYWPDQASAQANADVIHAWMYANDADYKASVDSGQTVRWDVPHQTFIFVPTPPFLIPDPNDKRYYINISPRCWGALNIEQQDWVTSGGQTFLQWDDKTQIMADASTGLRDY